MEDEELLANYELVGENFRYETQADYEFALKFLSMSKEELEQAVGTPDFERARSLNLVDKSIDEESDRVYERTRKEVFNREMEGWEPTNPLYTSQVLQAEAKATREATEARAKTYTRIATKGGPNRQIAAIRAESVLREKKASMSEDEFKLAVFGAKARKRGRQEQSAQVDLSFTDLARQDDTLMDFRPEAILSTNQERNGGQLSNTNMIQNTPPRRVKTQTGGVLDVTNEDVSAVPA